RHKRTLTVYSPTFVVYPDDVYPRTTLARVYGKEPDSQDLSPCCSVFRSRFLRQVTVIRLSYISQHRNSIHRNMSYFLWCWLPWPEMLPDKRHLSLNPGSYITEALGLGLAFCLSRPGLL